MKSFTRILISDYSKVSQKAHRIYIYILIFLLPILISVFYKDFCNSQVEDFVDTLTNFVTLFIPFGLMSYSLLYTNDNQTVKRLKNTVLKDVEIDKKSVSLYKVLHIESSFLILINILFLIILYIQKLTFYLSLHFPFNLNISLNLTIMAFILGLIMQFLKQIYFAFWKDS